MIVFKSVIIITFLYFILLNFIKISQIKLKNFGNSENLRKFYPYNIYNKKICLKKLLLTLNIFFDKIYERGFRKEREVFKR